MTSKSGSVGKALLAFVAPLALLSAVSCAGEQGTLTSPSAALGASATESGLAASSPRSGDLYVTKECSQNAGLAGQSARSRPRKSRPLRSARGSSI